MQRFYYQKSYNWIKSLCSIALFLGFFCIFFIGISGVSKETSEKQIENLNRAITKSVAHCYATEGHYPENLEYLTENYGISYDKEKYFIDYQVLGENIFPDISILILDP